MNKIFFITFVSYCQAVFTLNWNNVCSCGNVYTQLDCEMAGCTWSNNSCSKPVCSTFTTEATCVGGCFWNSGACLQQAPFCRQFMSQQECDFKEKEGCAWSADGKCNAFTKCSDYYFDGTTPCIFKGYNLQYCQESKTAVTIAGKQKCEDMAYVTCANLLTEATCSGYQKDMGYCKWISNKCTSVLLTTCSDGDGAQFLCGRLQQCWYQVADNKCVNMTCPERPDEVRCNFINSIDLKSASLCEWVSGKCQDVQNTNALTAADCYLKTRGTYVWNNNACVACAINYSVIPVVIFIGSLLLLM